MERPNGLRQPPPDEGHSLNRTAIGHTTTWKIAPTGRSAERIVGRQS
jgi:hypothetical protein